MKTIDTDSLVTLSGPRWKWSIVASFIDHFPQSEFSHFDDFVHFNGEDLKRESTTTITIYTSPERGDKFVIKCNRYPHIRTFPTIWEGSLAAREFANLFQCRQLGGNAVVPVGYGVLWRVGKRLISSDFLITRYIEDGTSVRAWVRENTDEVKENSPVFQNIIKCLGKDLHHLHKEGFFVGTPNLRNILMENAHPHEPVELSFLDIPYSQYKPGAYRARKAQRNDLGRVFGPFLRRVDISLMEPFFATYLPDPLGRSDEAIRNLVGNQARIHNNETMYSYIRFLASIGWKFVWRRFEKLLGLRKNLR